MSEKDMVELGGPPSPHPVGAAPPVAGRGRRRAHRQVLAVAAALLVGALLVGLAVVRVPYYALAPGHVRSTERLIEVKDGEHYDAEGDVLFTTVSVRGRITLWEVIGAWLDPAVEVVPERDLLGDRTQQENRQANRELMVDSKSRALRLAFEKLGYQVARPVAAVLTSVQAGSPADGLVEAGEAVVAIDGVRIRSSEEVLAALAARRPGDEVQLALRRIDPAELVGDAAPPASGAADAGRDPADPTLPDVRTVRVVLGARPDNAAAAFLGVGLQTQNAFRFPVEVEIDSGSVIGPSAGLAFTLGVLDVLTPGELTGGERVAVTGTIDERGRVGPIGGIVQKAAAVRRSGAKVFIVPAATAARELEEARHLAGDDLELFPVNTLDEALEALATQGGNALALPPLDGSDPPGA
ncbi:MAG: PDZ domain-containing protein [Acidimicrobiales bacterium]